MGKLEALEMDKEVKRWKACVMKFDFGNIRAAYGYIYDSDDGEKIIRILKEDFLNYGWKEVKPLKFVRPLIVSVNEDLEPVEFSATEYAEAEIVPVDLKELVSRWIDDLAYIAYVRPRDDGLERIPLAWEYMKYAPETYLAQKIGANC